MRVLILSVTAGMGHIAAANALAEQLAEHGAEALVLDIYEYLSRFVRDAIDKGYSLTTRYAPLAWRIIYRILDSRRSNPTLASFDPVVLANALVALRFRGFTDAFEPDCIVCTHPLAAQVVNQLKRRGRLNATVIGVNTDFTILPYWEDCTAIEYIVIASELMAYRALRHGIQPYRLLPTGIPIKAKFATKLPQREARQRFGLAAEAPTLLMMSGSMGYGDMAELVDQVLSINLPIEVVVVCGNNESLYQTLVDKTRSGSAGSRLHVFGFTDEVDLLMDAADCIVTKPGGLTVSESLAKRLPMILFSPIPGQEEGNTEFLLNVGAALRVTRTLPIDEAVFFLFDNPGRRRMMRESIDMLSKPNSSRDLADFIMGLPASGNT